jgi:hypothetical protein
VRRPVIYVDSTAMLSSFALLGWTGRAVQDGMLNGRPSPGTDVTSHSLTQLGCGTTGTEVFYRRLSTLCTFLKAKFSTKITELEMNSVRMTLNCKDEYF